MKANLYLFFHTFKRLSLIIVFAEGTSVEGLGHEACHRQMCCCLVGVDDESREGAVLIVVASMSLASI